MRRLPTPWVLFVWHIAQPGALLLLIHFASTPAWLWMTVVLKTTSCCGLIDHATECARLRLCLLVDTVTPCTAVARQHEATVPAAQGCLFNEGHPAYLLFSPHPAFHPAPGEQGDR